MAEPTEASDNIKNLVKKIKELEEQLTQSNSEKGSMQAELKKLKDELVEANSWIL